MVNEGTQCREGSISRGADQHIRQKGMVVEVVNGWSGRADRVRGHCMVEEGGATKVTGGTGRAGRVEFRRTPERHMITWLHLRTHHLWRRIKEVGLLRPT